MKIEIFSRRNLVGLKRWFFRVGFAPGTVKSSPRARLTTNGEARSGRPMP
jgi:hypothetical protein